MSIYKHVNGKNNDREFLQKKYNYITDPLKTDGGKLVGSVACISEHGTDDWIAVKKIYHKTDGKQGEHITISPSPDKETTSDETYLNFAIEVAEELFSNYNCITSVHKDSKRRHIHILFNSISFVDGKRFHSSKSDLAENKLKVNRLLEKYGFNIIRTSTDEMIDTTPYDLADSFDGLEITEYDKEISSDKESFKLKNWSLDDILVDATDEDLYDYLDGKDITKKKTSQEIKLHPYIYDCESEEDYMINNYNSYPVQQVNTPLSYSNNTTVQTANNEKQPIQNNAVTYPTMTLNFAPKINLNVTPETTNEEIKNRLNTLTPKISSSDCMKTAIVMATELDRRNINMNIEVNIFPELTLKFDDTTDKSSESNIIDIQPNDNW